MIRTTLLLAIVALSSTLLAAEPAGAPLGGLQLVEGYKHERLQGIDSVVGRIVRQDGFTINYEKGRIPDPNAPFRLGGDFSNAAERVPADQREWSREQQVGDAPVQLVLRKDATLVVTYPNSGINFHAKIEKQSDLADVLTMLLTFPAKPATEKE